MLEWLTNYGSAVSAAANIGMLLVWVVYLGTFLRQFRRQTQPKIVINKAVGSDLDAACFISNMSSEPIYVEAIQVAFESRSGNWDTFVTDMAPRRDDDVPSDPRQRTRQGPMRSGDYMPIGSFSELLERVANGNEDLAKIDLADHKDPLLHVRVFADYASEDLVVGADRCFYLERRNEVWTVRTLGEFTRQIRSRRQRLWAQHQLRD